MRKCLWVLLLTVVFGLPCLPVFASENSVSGFIIGKPFYVVENKVMEMDGLPFVFQGKAYVPMRYLAYTCGVTPEGVSFENNTITLVKGATTVRAVLGSNELCINGTYIQMDVAPIELNGRVYLPARWIAAALGCEVIWSEKEQAIVVVKVPATVATEPAATPAPVVASAPQQVDTSSPQQKPPTPSVIYGTEVPRLTVEQQMAEFNRARIEAQKGFTIPQWMLDISKAVRERGVQIPSTTLPSIGIGSLNQPAQYWIENMIDGGKYIKLSNGLLFEVAPLDSLTTVLWLEMDKVVVVKGNDLLYPYILINTSKGQSVKAKLVSSLSAY